MKSELMYSPQNDPYKSDPAPLSLRFKAWRANLRGKDSGVSRHMIIAIIMTVSLIAFELFNFDTTRFALSNFLGGAGFFGVSWAVILAIAFCAIDFSGLVRMFTPESGMDEPRAVWYLMGAWLLGATMNAVMTWWAVSLTLLDHDFGNEVLSRSELLRFVPVFVAVLVWLTRILFIGSITVAGGKLINQHRSQRKRSSRQPQASQAATPPATTRQSAPTAAAVQSSSKSAQSSSNGRAQIKERPTSVPSRRPGTPNSAAPRPAPKPAPKQSVTPNSYDDRPTVVVDQKQVAPLEEDRLPSRPPTNTPNTAGRVKRRPPVPRNGRPPTRGTTGLEARPRR